MPSENSKIIKVNKQAGAFTLPALRASMGDRPYYVSTLTLADVAARVSFAKEIHSNKDLNDLIQRRLNDKRAKEISDYLIDERQRFFNSIVIGVYSGNPVWRDFEEIQASDETAPLDIPDFATETFGFLQLSGNEKLFAIDGQHRVAGIRMAIKKRPALSSERVSVIFIAHEPGEDGLQRTRRIFTILNKSAKPVLKGDIIALDEDDMMAICTRRLLDKDRMFSRGQVAMRLRNSLAPSDDSSWTTVTMIYDMLSILFTQAYPWSNGERRVSAKSLKVRRSDKNVIDNHYDFAVEYFKGMCGAFGEVSAALDGESTQDAVQANRHSDGGNVLFRPLGQKMFTQIFADASKSKSMSQTFELMSKLPTNLNDRPYVSLIWDESKGKMINSSAETSLCRDVLRHMIGIETQRSESSLQKRYAEYIGADEKAQLPKVVAAA